MRITLTRTESFDPIQVMEEAAAQAAAERVIREHADPANPDALSYRFEKESNFHADQIDLVIEGEDQTVLGLVLRRLESRGYSLTVEHDPDEHAPPGVDDRREAGVPKPYASEVENLLMDRGWLVREDPRPGFAAEADSVPEDGTLSLVAYDDGKITYYDRASGYSRDGHADDPLAPHQLAEEVADRRRR